MGPHLLLSLCLLAGNFLMTSGGNPFAFGNPFGDGFNPTTESSLFLDDDLSRDPNGFRQGKSFGFGGNDWRNPNPSPVQSKQPDYVPKIDSRSPGLTKNSNKLPSKGKNSNVMQSITKKKFYFQAKPVVPDGEVTNVKETVYYLE